MIIRRLTCMFLLVAALAVPTAISQAGPPAAGREKLLPGLEGTPVVPVPPERWGELEPATILEDSTWKVSGDTGDTPFPHHLDIEGNFLFYATGQGVQIYDVSIPASPVFETYSDGSSLAPFWAASDSSFALNVVDAPPENPDIAATSAGFNGFIVWDTRNKNLAPVHYQDAEGRSITGVYAANIGGTDYAFATDSGGAFVLYDLDQASNYVQCLENTEVGINCPGVFKGEISKAVTSISGVDDMIVTRIGNAAYEVYRITSPSLFASSQPRMTGTLPGIINAAVGMFKYDYDGDAIDEYYVAAIGSSFVNGQMKTWLWIYDVSCARVSNCAAPNWLAQYDVTDFSKASARQHFLSVSYDGGTPYLYVGNANVGNPGGDLCVGQREFLIDLTLFNPSNPPSLDEIEITPQGHPGGYWSWYYQECHVNGLNGPPGFNDTQPRYAKVKKGYVFRAAFSFGDSHRVVGASTAPPTANFTWDVPAWSDGVQFWDASTGFPAPAAWSWAFTDAPSSSLQNPLVTFSSPGNKAVSLMAFNSNGWSGPVEKIVTALDPTPGVTEVTANPASAIVCSQVTFQATGVSGREVLSYDWSVEGGGPPPPEIFDDGFESGDTTSWSSTVPAPSPAWTVAAQKTRTLVRRKELVDLPSCTTATCPWEVPVDQATGEYAATVTVTSSTAAGSASATSAALQITALTPIVPTDPTFDTPQSAAVQFHLTLQGASEWRWNWGDGTSSGWTGDPADPGSGLDPVHTYAIGGLTTVTVDFRQCGDDATLQSSNPVEVDVPEPVNLNIVSFDILCPFGICFVQVGDTVLINSQAEGNPTGYEYDWDGDGIFEDVRASGDPNTPAISHVFTTTGCRAPVMKITRGAASVSKAGNVVCVNS